MRALLDLFSPRRNTGPKADDRRHLVADDWPSAIYAIGDVHGCLNQLRALEAQIVADAAAIPGEKWLVMLGDYVDRGPDSAGVLDHLTRAAPEGFNRICLAGNHEVMMLQYLDNPGRVSDWLRLGGLQTLASYGIDAYAFEDRGMSNAQRRQTIEAHLPQNHMAFLQSLPLSCSIDNLIFVHAGMRAGRPVTDQSESDLLWMRYEGDDPGPSGHLVVHGHTPQAQPLLLPNRICLDTGVFATGTLTAARFMPDTAPKLFQATG